MLKGNLSGFSLGEIFQSLAINRHTGTLTVRLPGGGEKFIYFKQGKIILFSHGKPETPRIGEILLASGKLTEAQLRAALKTQRATSKYLGLVLLEQGCISEEDIREAVELKIREELYDLFLANEGEFEFQLDHLPEDIFDAIQRSVRISLDPNSVIMEGLRRVDEWGLIRKSIRTFNEIYAPTADPPAVEDPLAEAILARVDGATPVEEVCRAISASRFAISKAIHRLLSEGAIQPVDAATLRLEAEKAISKRKVDQAIRFLRFAVELRPDEPGLLAELGASLARCHLDQESEKAYLEALRLYSERADWAQAAAIADLLPPNADLSVDELGILLRTYVHLKLTKKALWAGNQLALLYQKQGLARKAAEVLESIAELDPADLNLKLQVAALLRGAGEKERAIQYYEEVAAELEEQKRLKDQIKILRILGDLDPQRADVKQKISQLVAREQKREARRKHRITVAGAGLILLLALSVVPLTYELKARELYAHGLRMEEIAMARGEFTPARKIYEEILREYGMSTRARAAQLALERLTSFERNHLELIRLQQAQQENQLAVKQRVLVERFFSLLQAAREAEAAGDLEEAHRILAQALAMRDLHPRTRSARVEFPLQITSDPPAARVEVNGEERGHTPVVLHYEPGAEWSLRVSLEGCEGHERSLVLASEVTLHFDLPRRPSATFELPTPFDQPLALAAGNLMVPSRDGHLYALSVEREEMPWPPVEVGRFGDRGSDLHGRESIVFLATVDGEVLAVDATTGRKRILARIGGPVVAAPATSPGGPWLAVSNLDGQVYLIELETGSVTAAFAAENEITTRPVFAGPYLVAGATDSFAYCFDTRTRTLRFLSELTGAVRVDPVAREEAVVLATADRRLHRLDPEREAVSWTSDPLPAPAHSLHLDARGLLVLLESGQVLEVDPQRGTVRRVWKVASDAPGGMATSGASLYVTYHSGMVVAWDMERGAPRWRWEAGSPITIPPLLHGSRLFLGGAAGRLHVMETLE